MCCINYHRSTSNSRGHLAPNRPCASTPTLLYNESRKASLRRNNPSVPEKKTEEATPTALWTPSVRPSARPPPPRPPRPHPTRQKSTYQCIPGIIQKFTPRLDLRRCLRPQHSRIERREEPHLRNFLSGFSLCE